MTMIRRLSVRDRVVFRDEVDAGALSDVNCAFATPVESVREAAGARSMTYLNPGAPSPGGSRNRRWTRTLSEVSTVRRTPPGRGAALQALTSPCPPPRRGSAKVKPDRSKMSRPADSETIRPLVSLERSTTKRVASRFPPKRTDVRSLAWASDADGHNSKSHPDKPRRTRLPAHRLSDIHIKRLRPLRPPAAARISPNGGV